MIRNHISLALVGIFFWSVGVPQSRAQLSPPEIGTAGVIGTGVVTLNRRPELLRLQIQISAEGKDAKEALAKLKEKQAAARDKLKSLGVVEGSVRFSDPQTQDASQRQQMERMIQMRMGGQPKRSKNQTPALTVSTTLKAEWPLTAKDGDALLIESQELETNIKAAQLGADKSGKSSPAEEEEAAEEAQDMNPSEPQVNPREPVFLFVSKLSEAEQDKARADAFKKARADAERLAKASGNGLGPIRLLTSNGSPSSLSNPEVEMYDGGFQQRMMYNQMNGQEGDEPGEAIGPQPGKVGYRITVYVSFDLKPQ